MSDQECALYGDLVRHLRDQCIERITRLDPAKDAQAAEKWVNGGIRDWFFSKQQEDLHGNAPRDVIWRERKGEGNLVDDGYKDEMLFDDCPMCQEMKEIGREWHWHFDDGGYLLIAEYDPEGWDAFWKEDEAKLARQKDAAHEQGNDLDEDQELRKLFGEEDEGKI